MADQGEVGVVPDEATASHEGGGSETVHGALSFLSATWVNERVKNTVERANVILSRIIDEGLLVDGFGPFESPVTPDMIDRMTPEQFQAYLSTLPSEQEKAQALAVLQAMKLPNKEIFAGAEKPTPSPAPNPHLAFGPGESLNSTGISGVK